MGNPSPSSRRCAATASSPPTMSSACSVTPPASTRTSGDTTSTPPSTRHRTGVSETRRSRGILDTSVVIDLEHVTREQLPIDVTISAITMAELAAGPHATIDPAERARRQDRLQRAEAVFDPLPFDADAARAYGRVYAAVAAAGRKARGARAIDLLIAATAASTGLPLYTRNPDDFRGIDDLIEIIAIESPQ